MLDVLALREQLIRPTLKKIHLWSLAAENLIVGTGLIESRYKYLCQVPHGPALGFWQIEPFTYDDIINRIPSDILRQNMLRVLNFSEFPDAGHLVGNMYLSIIIARLKYYLDPYPLPNKDEINLLSRYWGRVYNTLSLKDKMDEFVVLYNKYGQHDCV